MNPIQQTKKLVFIHGDKGGVGKSTFARLLADYYVTHDIPWKGFDTDSTNGHLFRFYKEQTRGVGLRETHDIDVILNELEGDAGHLLVDLGARSGEILMEWMEQTGFLALREELGFSLVIVFLLSPIVDSTALLLETFEKVGTQARYVIVKNRAVGGDFSFYDRSKTKEKLEAAGAIHLELPVLEESAYNAVDYAGVTWSAACADSRLQLAQRQRVKMFVRAVFAEMEKAGEVLL
jgi:hypothetical protein